LTTKDTNSTRTTDEESSDAPAAGTRRAAGGLLVQGSNTQRQTGDDARPGSAQHPASETELALESLRASEQRLRLIVENARDYAIFTLDLDGFVTDWREGAEAVFGYARGEIIGTDGDKLFTPEDNANGVPEQERAVAAAIGSASDVRWHVCKDGHRVFIEGVNTALYDGEGNLTGYLKIGRDGTERHQADRRQQLLLEELQHRVRNILAMVRSLIRQSTEGHTEVDDFVAHLTGRLDAIARTQVLLTRTAGATIDLETLVREELLNQLANEMKAKVAGPAVSLSPKAAEVLTLALHELATNSLKYGALSDPDGHLSVTWAVEPRGQEQWLDLAWDEVCRQVPPLPVTPGFGTELIKERVPYELKGNATLQVTGEGVHARIAFPLTEGKSILESRPTAGV
jgi:PAS domain S-box-containing protein